MKTFLIPPISLPEILVAGIHGRQEVVESLEEAENLVLLKDQSLINMERLMSEGTYAVLLESLVEAQTQLHTND